MAPEQKSEMSLARVAVVALLAFGIGAFLALALIRLDRATTAFPETPQEQRASIGGPFHLIGPTGRRVTESNFRGKFMLLTFGYTRSADLTPAMLQLMAAVLNKLTLAESAKITPVFITLDPVRDTQDALADYLARFSPRFVGLTGTKQEVADAAAAWRVPVERAINPAGGTSDDFEYPAYIYLMGPEGTYIAHFSPATGIDELHARLVRELHPRSRL